MKNPDIRWLLLDNEEWKMYYDKLNIVNLWNLNAVDKDTETFYFNMFVVEMLRRKTLLKKYPETKKMIVERGFINYDNVLMMNEQVTEDIFREETELCTRKFGNYFYSIDSIRLSILVLEIINIYKFRLGKSFTGTLTEKDMLPYEILENYLEKHGINPKIFELPITVRSVEQKQFEDTIFNNIWKALMQKEPSILKDNNGKEIAIFNIGELIKEKKGKIRITFGSMGLTVKGNFVGLGHIQYSPEFLGARNIREVLDAWNYMINKFRVNPEDLQMALESSSLMGLLLTGIEEGKDVNILSIFVDLKELESLGINIEPKVQEFGEEIRGHIRSFCKLEKKNMWHAILVAQALRKYLSNASSECSLARIAKFYGFSVNFKKNPDLIINGKGFEVKRANSLDFRTCLRDAQKQPHEIIAIEVNSLKEIVTPNHEAIWTEETNLKTAIKASLEVKWEGDVVLLFMGTTTKGLRARILCLTKE